MLCGLIGEHLGHSFSPELHALLGDYRYTLFELAPDALEAFFRRTDWHGVNVTIPYKKAVIPYCDTLSDTARRIQSVN
ncbi:MAG: shikimate kinase, partial [Oscillospiraceae bacterium]